MDCGVLKAVGLVGLAVHSEPSTPKHRRFGLQADFHCEEELMKINESLHIGVDYCVPLSKGFLEPLVFVIKPWL